MRIVNFLRLVTVCFLLSSCAASNPGGKVSTDGGQNIDHNLADDVPLVGHVGPGIALPTDQCEESDEQGARCAPTTRSPAPAALPPDQSHAQEPMRAP